MTKKESGRPITLDDFKNDPALRERIETGRKVAQALDSKAALPPSVDEFVNKALKLADDYVVAATGDTARARHQYSAARKVLRAHLEAGLAALQPPVQQRDKCELCHGARGGVPGNENRIDGKVMCDYCHTALARAIEVFEQEVRLHGTYLRWEGDGQFGMHHESDRSDPNARGHLSIDEIKRLLPVVVASLVPQTLPAVIYDRFPQNAVLAVDLTGHTEMFGWKRTKRMHDGKPIGDLIDLYVEDDGFWHVAMSFDENWLTSLLHTVALAMQRK